MKYFEVEAKLKSRKNYFHLKSKISHPPQFPRLEAVHSVVSVDKYFHEWFHIKFVDLAEPLAHQTKELLVGSLLRAAVDDHVAELGLLPRLYVQLIQFMNRLLEVQGRLDCQVDGSSQGN